MKPNMLFIGSKQIDYVQYDEANGQLYIHYTTGRTDAYGSVSPHWYERLLRSENRYDDVVQLTVRSRTEASGQRALSVDGGSRSN
ncbi:MAG: KTSC domain-containing protein [Paenibacillus dendritiformis]|uniref:KTSC domain-containing protein n=1 Tax=uncultured Paenibacillus sp. TaxID=227322 RepID=UPI0025F4BDEC|nr:KTSC domain-containing protein [uncultured Paenibacillus sp.]MDU5143222.1 KTSC domain-containing protein [Paenibacillus dendritiformis]